MLTLDHLVLAGETLEAATEAAEAALGLPLAGGGQHLFMGTHNRLLGMGPDVYFEAIAIDPTLPAPDRVRWFGLDGFTGAPRLVTAVFAAPDRAAMDALPEAYAEPEAFQRGDLTWHMALPDPESGLPPVIAWGPVKAQSRLPDSGARVTALTLTHPAPYTLPPISAPGLRVAEGPLGVAAEIATPAGVVTL